MKMTKELLEELGSCGDYTRVFRRLFPVEQFPLGVEVNEDVCAENATKFSWSWAVEQMLDGDGYREYSRVYQELDVERAALNTQFQNERAAWKDEYSQRYNTPDWDTSAEARDAYNALETAQNARLTEARLDAYQLEARAFGRVFDTRPDLRHPRVARAQEASVAKTEDRIITAYNAVVNDLEYSRQQLATWTEKVPELEKREAELLVAAIPARANRAARNAEMLASRVTDAERALEMAKTAADEAKIEAEKLAADVVAQQATTEPETTTDDTAADTHEVAPQEEATTSSAS